MSAFAAAVGALFADPNIGRDAVYIAEGGAPILVRVVARRADAITDFGDARLWSETTASTCACPRFQPRAPATGSRSTAMPSSSRASRPRPRAAGLDCRPAPGVTAMKLKLDIDPDIVAMMAAEVAAGERAVSAAIREAGTGLKAPGGCRSPARGSGPGSPAPSGRSSSPRPRPSLNAAVVVWSNAPVIVGAHDTGSLIRSKSGFWLAIPTPSAGKSLRGGRITPGEWERRTGLRLRFIYRRRGPSLLVAEGRLDSKGRAVASRSKTGRGLVTAPIFLLVPQVKLPKTAGPRAGCRAGA